MNTKKLTNRERCRRCLHSTVCKYKGSYDGLEVFGERCNHYFFRGRATYQKKKTTVKSEKGE